MNFKYQNSITKYYRDTIANLRVDGKLSKQGFKDTVTGYINLKRKLRVGKNSS